MQAETVNLTDVRKRSVLIGLLFGMLLGALDQTIMGTAMPKVIASLGGMNLYAWVFTAYMLASTASVPIFGKLGDLYGRKWFYIGSLALFMLGSALCGASRNMTELIIFRALQGIGGGAMMANAMAIVGDIFPPAERGRYQGAMGAIFGLASVIGPFLGGYLTDNLNWRWVFYVNLPVGLIAIAILLTAMPYVRTGVKKVIDYTGVVTLLGAVIPMLLAFTWAGNEYAWGSPTIVGLLSFAAFFWVVFILVERRAAEPILPIDLFSNSIFSVSTISVFLTGAGLFGATMFIPLFMQAVIGVSATNSGMLLMPMMLSMVVASVVAGQIISKSGKYKWMTILALFTMTGGMYFLAGMSEASTQAEVIRNMIIIGLGLGVTIPVFIIAVQNAVTQSRLGVATASLQFFRSIGGTIGVAVFGSFLTSSMQREVSALIPEPLRQALPADVLKAGLSSDLLMNPQALSAIKAQVPAMLQPLIDKLLVGIKHAMVVSLHDVFLAGLVAILLSTLVTFFLREIPLRRSNTDPTERQGEMQGEMEPKQSLVLSE